MNVGNALAVPLFMDFQNASECIRSHGPDSCCIMGVKGKVADRTNLPFHVLEFVRSDLGIWVLEHNKASLPLGGLSSTTWIRRLQSVSIFRPVDACIPWTWKGRTMSTSVLVRFYMAEEGNDAGFVVSGTIAETLAGWDAAEWSTDARGLGAGIDFATVRGFRVVSLEMSIPIIKLNLLPFFSVLFRALRLPDPHVI